VSIELPCLHQNPAVASIFWTFVSLKDSSLVDMWKYSSVVRIWFFLMQCCADAGISYGSVSVICCCCIEIRAHIKLSFWCTWVSYIYPTLQFKDRNNFFPISGLRNFVSTCAMPSTTNKRQLLVCYWQHMVTTVDMAKCRQPVTDNHCLLITLNDCPLCVYSTMSVCWC